MTYLRNFNKASGPPEGPFSGYSGHDGDHKSKALDVSGCSGYSGYSGFSGSGAAPLNLVDSALCLSGCSGRSGHSGTISIPDDAITGRGISGVSGYSGSSLSTSLKETVIETHHIVEIPPGEIVECTSIPDYTTESILDQPLVMRCGTQWFCLERFDLVNEAVRQSQPMIRCRTIEVPRADVFDVAVYKTASRIKTSGGKATYGEIVCAVNHLAMLAQNFSYRFTQNSHGGDRRSRYYRNVSHTDLTAFLVRCLNKTRNVVNDYLSYGKYLDSPALLELAKSSVRQKDLRRFQVIKRNEIAKLEKDGKTVDEITAAISQLLLDWLNDTGEFAPGNDATHNTPEESVPSQQNDSQPNPLTSDSSTCIQSSPPTSDGMTDALPATVSDAFQHSPKGKPQEFKHWTPKNQLEPAVSPPTEADCLTAWHQFVQELVAIPENTSFYEFAALVDKHYLQYTEIRNMFQARNSVNHSE